MQIYIHSKKIVYKETLSLCIKMCHTNVMNANLHSLKKNSLKRRIQSVHQNIVLQCEECDSIITDTKIVEKSDALAKKD